MPVTQGDNAAHPLAMQQSRHLAIRKQKPPRSSIFTYAGARRPSDPILPVLVGGGGGNSSRVFSAIIRWKAMPTPSITANRIAHPIAPFRMARGPPRTASAPPVKPPAMMAFQGSSFLRTPLTAQSKEEKRPPQTPKLPPRTGARALMAVMAASSHCSVSTRGGGKEEISAMQMVLEGRGMGDWGCFGESYRRSLVRHTDYSDNL